MAPSRVRYVPNPDFGRDMKRELDAKAQAVADEVAGRFATDPSLDVAAELNAGLARVGINLPDATLNEWADIILRGSELKVDIHIV